MAKVVLAEIAAGLGSTDVINSNFQAIADALDNTVSRDGTTPNHMEADLDLNGNTLLNTGTSDDPNRVVNYQELTDYVAEHSSGVVVQRQELHVATSGQTTFDLTEISYTPGAFNLAVYVDGVRMFAPTDYTEVSTTQIVFVLGVSLGAEVQFVTNEFLGSIEFPAHTHPWTQITNVPVYTTRWPDWTEVTGKPVSFTPASHQHAATDITSGRLADARRGVYVQASQPSGAVAGDLWFW